MPAGVAHAPVAIAALPRRCICAGLSSGHLCLITQGTLSSSMVPQGVTCKLHQVHARRRHDTACHACAVPLQGLRRSNQLGHSLIATIAAGCPPLCAGALPHVNGGRLNAEVRHSGCAAAAWVLAVLSKPLECETCSLDGHCMALWVNTPQG